MKYKKYIIALKWKKIYPDNLSLTKSGTVLMIMLMLVINKMLKRNMHMTVVMKCQWLGKVSVRMSSYVIN